MSNKLNNNPEILGCGKIVQATCRQNVWRWGNHLSASSWSGSHRPHAEINNIFQPGTGGPALQVTLHLFFSFYFFPWSHWPCPPQAPFSWFSDLLRSHPHFGRPLQDGKTFCLIPLDLGRVFCLFVLCVCHFLPRSGLVCDHVCKQQLCLITNSFACCFAHNCSHMEEESLCLKVTVFPNL